MENRIFKFSIFFVSLSNSNAPNQSLIFFTYIYIYIGSLAKWVECSPMVRETWVQSQVASYQRLLKWYLIPPCLILSNIRYISRVKWSNPGKGVAIEKRAFWSPSTTVANPTKPKHYCIVWNGPPRALASVSMHTKRNICAIIKQATSPHLTEPFSKC